MKKIILLLSMFFVIVNFAAAAEVSTLTVENSKAKIQKVEKQSIQKTTKDLPLKTKGGLTQNYLLLGIVLILLGTIYLVAPAVFGYLFITAGVMFVILSLLEQGAI